MIQAIKRFFEENLAASSGEDENHKVCRIQLASAALLMEVMKVDQGDEAREAAILGETLKKTFKLDEASLQQIIELAEEEARQATSLYDFTSLVNDFYDRAEKVELIENMWRVAYADGRLDKYEEQLIRKTADLIYVSHSDFMKTKLKVREQAEQDQLL